MAVLTGDKYLKHRLELEDVVDRFASVVHLIFEESARLSLIPAKMAAFLKIPAWKNFVSAIDEAISLGKHQNTAISCAFICVMCSVCGKRKSLIHGSSKMHRRFHSSLDSAVCLG